MMPGFLALIAGLIVMSLTEIRSTGRGANFPVYGEKGKSSNSVFHCEHLHLQ